MPAICLYFQVHQPYRLRSYRIFDVGQSHDYFDEAQNSAIIRRVADKCYLRANAVLAEILQTIPGFRCAFSLTGTALDQLAAHAPETVASFRTLVDSDRVELLGETDCHALSSEASLSEFQAQVALHRERIEQTFGVTPRVFRNTELVFHNGVARAVAALGFNAMLGEGADTLLGWRSPNHVYRAAAAPGLRLLMRNYRLSDDIAFRFSSRDWIEYPLTAPKLARWLAESPGDVINLFMDYETFGEHHWPETGILDFLRHLPEAVLAHPGLSFVTPSEVVERCPSVDELGTEHALSWADSERDLSAWLGNTMQQDALQRLYALESQIRATDDPALLRDWRRLQTSDHFYYMCTKSLEDGTVHSYFSPYDSPYDAFVVYNNVLLDLKRRLERAPRFVEK